MSTSTKRIEERIAAMVEDSRMLADNTCDPKQKKRGELMQRVWQHALDIVREESLRQHPAPRPSATA